MIYIHEGGQHQHLSHRLVKQNPSHIINLIDALSGTDHEKISLDTLDRVIKEVTSHMPDYNSKILNQLADIARKVKPRLEGIPETEYTQIRELPKYIGSDKEEHVSRTCHLGAWGESLNGTLDYLDNQR